MAARRRPFLSAAWRRYWLWHPLIGGAIHTVFFLVRLLPVDRASDLGAWGGRRVGRLARTASARARANLAIAFPEKTVAERERILSDMWAHLGRIGTEYPHLTRLAQSDRIEIGNVEIAEAVLMQPLPIVFFSGHTGHWEVGPALGARHNLRVKAIYRPPNNRFVDRIIREIREACGVDLVVRGAESVQTVLGEVRAGGRIAMLVDQKRAYGVPVPLFGKPALTGTVLAQIATRIDCLVVPVRVERLERARFRVTCEPPLEIPQEGSREERVQELMGQVNGCIERWVRARPEQWLWPHRRWDT
ncbi:MAG: lauroyl acyltransferase [Rhodospirillaceae bacterium]|nr:lauroyl acyltransferase [Rhodospirillaceae bacterium]